MVQQKITPREADIGGLVVRRSLPVRTMRSVGPWVFFDHMGPADFEPGRGLDVIPHPHINLSTVTYLFEGEIVHRDSIGTVQTISPGAINLMVAGRGIVHSERTGNELRSAGHRAHGLQLWLGLPEEYEESEPAFYHHPAESLPRGSSDGVEYRVMIGEAFGFISPVKMHSPALYAEITIRSAAGIKIPAIHQEQAVYVVEGEIEIEGHVFSAPSMAIIEGSTEIASHDESRIILIGGEPLGKRYMWWNFVSSRKNRIEKAMDDWRDGRIGTVQDETEFAPLPESDSFSSMKE